MKEKTRTKGKGVKVIRSFSIDPEVLRIADYNAWQEKKSMSSVVEQLLIQYNQKVKR